VARNASPLNRNPEVMRLAELVEYQTGSVVSRTLIKKEKGTLTLFAFDKGEALSEHTAPFDAFVHIIDGEARITIEERSYQLSAGQALILPANRPHAVKAIKRFKMLLIMIRS
jgi:quercetin dioxygenase-like cupin family protein